MKEGGDMFTGIVDHCGCVRDLQKIASGLRITIETQFCDFALGESIAVDGVCLTLVEFSDSLIHFEISPETIEKTTAAAWQKNSRVNLERALRVGDRLGGHFVLGHVDTCVTVSEIKDQENYREMFFAVENTRYLVPKGSVAINGVSLTINEVFKNSFSVMLIPHTQDRTNLADLKVNDFVNIEFDYLVKAVVADCHSRESGNPS